METDRRTPRRWVLAALSNVGVAVVGAGAGAAARSIAAGRARAEPSTPDADPPVEGADTPLEDLMREHAVLERVLLVYEACGRRLATDADLDAAIVAGASGIVRRYIEDHHERDEETYLFPRLERVGVALDLVATLRVQHAAGRGLTSAILARATPAALRHPVERARLTEAMAGFVRMYRPHAAHENTVLFPAFRRAVPQREYEDLRDVLERRERIAFGPGLFDAVMTEVRGLEGALGIGDLAAFTPRDEIGAG